MFAAVYFVLGVLMHLQFSMWLVAERTVQWNGQTFSYSFRDALPFLLPIAALVLVAWLGFSAVRQGTRGRAMWVTGYWLVWLVCVAAVDRWLTFSVAEYFHFPQYGLLAMLLAKAMDAERTRWPVGRVLCLTTLLGAADELAQYLWITVSYSHYFDFNDVLVNQLAGMAGLMLYYGARVPPANPVLCVHTATLAKWCAQGLALLLAAGALVALTGGLVVVSHDSMVPPGGVVELPAGGYVFSLQREPGLYNRWHPGPWRGQHWVLGPVSSLCLMLGLSLA